uniref:Uncharacterized protein n=1 Tax=Ralstonia solanacearum TaxID=305 RepID=A0A0S4UAZ1_RALSL|nr:protein of unknown function [Ralstonia solanacearum]
MCSYLWLDVCKRAEEAEFDYLADKVFEFACARIACA